MSMTKEFFENEIVTAQKVFDKAKEALLNAREYEDEYLASLALRFLVAKQDLEDAKQELDYFIIHQE